MAMVITGDAIFGDTLMPEPIGLTKFVVLRQARVIELHKRLNAPGDTHTCAKITAISFYAAYIKKATRDSAGKLATQLLEHSTVASFRRTSEFVADARKAWEVPVFVVAWPFRKESIEAPSHPEGRAASGGSFAAVTPSHKRGTAIDYLRDVFASRKSNTVSSTKAPLSDFLKSHTVQTMDGCIAVPTKIGNDIEKIAAEPKVREPGVDAPEQLRILVRNSRDAVNALRSGKVEDGRPITQKEVGIGLVRLHQEVGNHLGWISTIRNAYPTHWDDIYQALVSIGHMGEWLQGNKPKVDPFVKTICTSK